MSTALLYAGEGDLPSCRFYSADQFAGRKHLGKRLVDCAENRCIILGKYVTLTNKRYRC